MGQLAVAYLSDLIGGTPITQRGFTDHEHLDDAQLIHMNGRVYDYNLGRFMSVDPFIHGVGNSQGINPYSYIMNNPLAGIDPTGYQCEPAGNSHCGDPIGEAPTSLTDNDATDTPVSNGQDLTVKAPGGNTSDIGKPSNTNSSNDGKPVERVTVTCDKQCQEDAKESGESGNMWAGMGVGGALSLALYDGPQPGPMDVIAVGAVIAVMALPGDSSSQNDDMTNMRGASESTGGDPNNEDPEDDFNEEDIVDVKIEISRRGKPQIRVTMKDGSVRIISRARTKIDVPEPRAAKGMRPQKFRNPLPGSKGKKRAPTNKELKLLDKHTRK